MSALLNATAPLDFDKLYDTDRREARRLEDEYGVEYAAVFYDEERVVENRPALAVAPPTPVAPPIIEIVPRVPQPDANGCFKTPADGAKFYASKGIPQVPLSAPTDTRFNNPGKNPAINGTGWPQKASTDPAQIDAWVKKFSGCNFGSVAKHEVGCYYVLECDTPLPLETYKALSGEEGFGARLITRSANGYHYWFLHDALSVALIKNIGQTEGFSLREHNEQCVTAGSVHKTGVQYAVFVDGNPAPASPKLLEWFQTKKKQSQSAAPPTNERGLIPHGGIHHAMTSYAGKLREIGGLELEDIEPLLLKWVHEHCEPPIDEAKVSTAARSVCGLYKKGDTVGALVISSANQSDEVLDVEDVAQILDMPSNVIPDCVLGTIARDYMSHIPLAYSLPALLTVAGTMVPPPERTVNESIAISQGAGSQTNLYTALIGPINSGKSQAIVHAVGNLGLAASKYDITKAGSAEGLLKKLAKKFGDIPQTSQRLINLDEWSFFFKKAGIENSSFVENLNSAFNNPEIRLTIAKGEEVSLNVALSLIGGIVTDGVQSCFGSESTTGFYDRFLFGVNPTLNVGEYRPFDISTSAQDSIFDKPNEPVAVAIDRSVWDLVAQWKKGDHTLGRAVEITVRCCAIVASFDGRARITDKDLEIMRPFLDYQKACRQIIQPTAGVTLDAKMANAILGWLKRHADGGQWVNQRDMKKGIHKVLDELGPGAFKNALSSLGMVHAIQTQVRKNEGTRDSYLIRLNKGS